MSWNEYIATEFDKLKIIGMFCQFVQCQYIIFGYRYIWKVKYFINEVFIILMDQNKRVFFHEIKLNPINNMNFIINIHYFDHYCIFNVTYMKFEISTQLVIFWMS
jgi:hypothetical protein